ncbi:AraC family transcriptional regulator [Streptomyces clavuligerus]|nr:transcriptional regulator [Streptomyces clavuligerus]AXU12204.1 AraC family transcriptional regulator [Streptomyces clavuligerus]EDY51704.1 transcriptional regulator [Streptomyces clavuligerus]MBY6302072.1 AraC family transcriptional regulator [Streptomyces clavuligerus]QCS04985.1 AraC family transcriptional regulator [Streptomyces clavuligerus]
MLDLDAVDPRERAAAFRHALTHESVPNDIVHEGSGPDLRARMESWRIGTVTCFSTHNSGFAVHRTAEHVRRHRSQPVVSVSMQTAGVGRAEAGGERWLLGPDDLCVFHELTPRVYGWSGTGASQAVLFDVDRLGLPVEAVLKASLRLRASPLHDLVLRHLRDLFRDPGPLEEDPGAAALANATTELVRSLLLSAVHDERTPPVRAVMDDTLVTRVMSAVRTRLTDPALTPARIAAEHAVSLRHLYGVLGRAGIGLEQWIITERLSLARRMLVSDVHRHLPIASVAARCGFLSPSHFSRRFRAAYGVTPREWRNGRDGTGEPGRPGNGTDEPGPTGERTPPGGR